MAKTARLWFTEATVGFFGRSRDREKASSHFESAALFARTGAIDDAIRMLELSLALSEKIGDSQAAARTLDLMAKLLADQGKVERALSLWQKAIDLHVELGNTQQQGALRMSRAVLTALTGDLPGAFLLAEPAFPLLEQVGDFDTLASGLWNLGEAAAGAGDSARAVGWFTRLSEVADRMGDPVRKALALRALGQLHFETRDFSSAVVALEVAYQIQRDVLGDAVGAAGARVDIALCRAEQGELIGALSIWEECLPAFERAGEHEQRAMLLHHMAGAAKQLGELTRALDFLQRAREAAHTLGDRNKEAVTLCVMAPLREQLGEGARAVELWREAIGILEVAGEEENRAVATRELAALLQRQAGRGDTGPAGVRVGSRLLDPGQPFSLSEYDLVPRSAPRFAVGELLAGMHAKGVIHGDVRPGNIVVTSTGGALVTSASLMKLGQAIDPGQMAADLHTAHVAYHREDFRAILAGYARASYELIDNIHAGFTDALLDALGAPADRPRPTVPPIDSKAVLRQLQVELTAADKTVTLVSLHNGSSRPEAGFSADAFLVTLALMAAGIDCQRIFERGQAHLGTGIDGQLFRFLRFVRCEPGLENPFSATYPEGLELAFALGLGLRVEAAASASFPFSTILPVARKVLVEGSGERAERLGETLVDVAQICAGLLAGDTTAAKSWLQQAIILSQYLARGTRRDEVRISALRRRLHQCAWFPALADHGRWPEDRQDLYLANSLLLTYRDAATSSHAGQDGTRPGMLWSAARRALALSRTMVRRCHALAMELPPAEAAIHLRLLQVVVNSYARTLECMLGAALREHQDLGGSGWLALFADGPDREGSLASELRWVAEFLSAFSGDDVTPQTIDDFVRRGARFIAESDQRTPS